MLLDDEEFQIMASAAQGQLRGQVSDELFRSILQNYFTPEQFAGSKILELGPGQHDFARLATEAGATVVTMDHDPAVVALGEKRGHRSMLADFTTFDWNSIRSEFDGLFLRHSVSAQWFTDPTPLHLLLDNICAVLKPNGWGWAAPWNRLRDKTPDQAEFMLNAQREAFARNGFIMRELVPPTSREDGIYEHWEVFLRGFNREV